MRGWGEGERLKLGVMVTGRGSGGWVRYGDNTGEEGRWGERKSLPYRPHRHA